MFRAWLEDWEEELLKKNDCVAEAMLLEKYNGMVFWDPDTKVNYTVHEDKLEFRRSKRGGWNLIGNSSDESVKDEGFAIGGMIIGMIAETEQAKGVEVILVDETEEDEEVPRDIWAIRKYEAEDKDLETGC